MADVRFTVAAVRDLDEICLYTYRSYGEEQADRYVREIKERLKALAERPRSGHGIEGVIGYLRANVRRHAIIYRPSKGGIIVVRVIHDRRNIEAVISDDPE